jgi:hypothetical protein
VRRTLRWLREKVDRLTGPLAEDHRVREVIDGVSRWVLRRFRTFMALVFCIALIAVWLSAVVVAGVGAALMAAVYACLAPIADRERIWVALERLRSVTTAIVGDLLAPPTQDATCVRRADVSDQRGSVGVE